jgi:Tfp pilus assembly protein PilZ
LNPGGTRAVDPPREDDMGNAGKARRRAQERREERRAYAGTIWIVGQLGSDRVRAKGLDLSAGGCFLFTSLAFEVGEILVLSLDLPDRPAMTLFGQVAHRKKARSGDTGYGISFLDLAEDERAALRRACTSLPPPVPKGVLAGLFA